MWVENEHLASKLTIIFENFINYSWFKSNLHYEKFSFLYYAARKLVA